jgi:predicted ribosomally synthesized peptide with nif11-like leader
MTTNASAATFLAKVRDDAEFRRVLAEASSDQEMLQRIKEAGFGLTAEEIGAALESWRTGSAAGKELSDTQLEAVAGGSIGFSSPPGGNLFLQRQLLSIVTPITYKGSLGL